jgi:hypothetical protein
MSGIYYLLPLFLPSYDMTPYFLLLFKQEDWEYILPAQARINEAGRLPRDLIVPVVADYAASQRQLHETLIMNIHFLVFYLFYFYSFFFIYLSGSLR